MARDRRDQIGLQPRSGLFVEASVVQGPGQGCPRSARRRDTVTNPAAAISCAFGEHSPHAAPFENLRGRHPFG